MAVAMANDHPQPRFVRYQSAEPHRTREGVYLGVFAMVNTLSRRGLLSPEQDAFRAATNRWFDEHLPNPVEVVPGLYSEETPRAVAWFKRSAEVFLARVPGYLEILDAHGVSWQAIASDDPGTILYEDAYQVVASPCPAPPGDATR
jgi:hypothetical protein